MQAGAAPDSESLRVTVLHKLPTPYNDYLFRALDGDRRVELRVFHLWRGNWHRPWQSELGSGYPNEYLPRRFAWPLVRAAWSDRDSLFIVGDWARPSTVGALLVRIALGAPVAIWTDTPQEQLARPFWKAAPRQALLRFLLGRVDAVLGSGRAALDALAQMGAPAASLIDFQFAVDLDRPAEARADPLFTDQVRRRRELGGQGSCLVGLFGTMIAKKGHDLAIEALAEVVRAGGDIHLLMAGAGPDRPALERRVAELGLGGHVTFLGWLEPDEVEVLYAAVDVVVHPSRYDPFPLVVLEAMAWGVPVVGSDTCGSVTERVQDGVNGIVVPARDVSALAAAMTSLGADPQARLRMGAAARKTAESWPVARTLDIVAELAQPLLSGGGAEAEPSVVAIGAYPPPVAGQSMAMQTLHDQLIARGFTVEALDIADPLERPSWPGRVHRALRLGLLAPRALARMRRGGDVLYLQLGRSSAALLRDLPVLVTARLLRWPTVGHLHGGGYASMIERLPEVGRRLVVWALGGAEIVVLSERLAGPVRRVLPRSRVHVISNGVEEEIRQRGAELTVRAATSPIQVLYLGNLIKDKGYVEVLRAAERCQREEVAAHFTIAGRRTATTTVDPDHYVAAHELDDVSVIAAVDRSALPAVLAAADVLVLPSRSEGQPLVLIEALHFGLALLAADVGGVADVVVDGVNGHLLDPDRDLAEQLADRLASLSRDGDLPAMQAASRERAGRFTARRHGRAMADVLRAATASGRQGLTSRAPVPVPAGRPEGPGLTGGPPRSPARRALRSSGAGAARSARRLRSRLGLDPTRPELPDADYERLRSVGIFLGPYRNLTTLTAAVLSLHPDCQVLNHAGGRVLGNPQLDFLADYSDARFRRFLQFVAEESRGGHRGDRGGSIMLSHAFRDDSVRDAYRERFGEVRSKDDATSYVWKESLAAGQALRASPLPVSDLLAADPRIRFIVPVRHPVDCALSNLRTGHARRFGAGPPRDDVEVLRQVVGEIAWCWRLHEQHPDRIFTFCEFEVGASKLDDLARFLDLEPDPRWLADATRCFQLREPYEHREPLVRELARLIEVHFGDRPEMAERMSRFLPSRPA